MNRQFPNYNIKTRRPARMIFAWSEKTGISLRVYDNFDGGGWNFYIVEFLSREELERFMAEFEVFGDAWVEQENGQRIG